MHAIRISVAAGTTVLIAACGLLPLADAASGDARRVKLPQRIVVDQTELVLNGEGVYTQSSLDRYLIGLYVTRYQARLGTLLTDRGRKRIALYVLRTTPSVQLGEMIVDAIAANHTESELESIKVPLDEFQALLGSIGLLRAGTSIGFDYVPGAGVQVVVHEKPGGNVIRGVDLYPALLRSWLGDDPIDRRLKRALLRGSSDTGAH